MSALAQVVFIIPSLRLGGAERHLARAVAVTSQHMQHAHVIVLSAGDSSIMQEFPKGTVFHILGCSTSASPWLWFQVRRLLMRIRPKVVVGWSTYANFVTVVATRFSRVSHIVLYELNYVPEVFAKKRTAKLRRFLVLSLVKVLYAKAHTIAANSQLNVRFLSKFIGKGPTYRHLPNIIDVALANDLTRIPFEIRPSDFEGPRILGLGRLDRQKGFDVLLEAFAIVQRDYCCRLLVVGDGPERERLHSLARALNVEEAVQWTGAVTNPFPYYRWADLVVLPSRYEGLPNVAVEAMACGRTIICSDCKSGPYEVTVNGRYGVLVDKENPTALARAIMTLIKSTEMRTRLGTMAQEHVRGQYDVRHAAKLYAEGFCLAP